MSNVKKPKKAYNVSETSRVAFRMGFCFTEVVFCLLRSDARITLQAKSNLRNLHFMLVLFERLFSRVPKISLQNEDRTKQAQRCSGKTKHSSGHFLF